MGEEFKAGDLVFVVDTSNKVVLGRFKKPFGSNALLIEALLSGENYMGFGYEATPENRQALVTLYGEDAVPKLELTGGEAVKHLLGLQKWVLCQVSNISETHARKGDVVALIDCADTILPFGSFYDGGDDWDYAVPVDMNGEEITISLVGWD